MAAVLIEKAYSISYNEEYWKKSGRDDEMKRLAALLAAAVLLVGCSGLEWLPQLGGDSAPADTAPEAVRQTVEVPVYLEAGAALPSSLEEYAQERGITLTQAATAQEAGLSVLAAEPQEGDWLDLQAQLVLDQALEGETFSLVGETIAYGYLPNTAALDELFGGSAPLDDMKASTYSEWNAFIQAVGKWLESPAQTTVTLNGVEYTLADQKGTVLSGVTGIFAIDCKTGYGMEALTPALTASGGDVSSKLLTGPLNSTWETFGLEQQYLAGTTDTDAAGAKDLCDQGKALFYRGRGQDAIAMKCSFDNTDMASGSGATVEGLATTPAQVPVGWLAISAQAGEETARQGLGYLVWLAGARELPGQETIMTGAQSAEVNGALTGFLGGTWSTTARSQYIKQVLAALA